MAMSLFLASLMLSGQPMYTRSRPVVSPRDLADSLNMCRAVTTPTGFDRNLLRKKRYQLLTATVVKGAPVEGLDEIYSMPDKFMMMTLREEGGQRICRISAQVRTNADLDKALAGLPVPLTGSTPDLLEGDEGGQHIVAFPHRDAKEPAIVMTVSRPMEPKSK